MIPLKDLKPCPFCNEKKLMDDIEIDCEKFVRCENCGAIGPWADTIEGAREEWNKRV
jgi:Lar family restriction alleviation protein